MKRIVVVSLTMIGLMLGSVPSLYAGWGNGGYPPPQQQGNPVLRNVLIGAGLIGAGYLLGRATAPKPVYAQPPLPIGPQPGYGQPWQQGNFHHGHHGNMPMPGGYRF